MQKTPVLCVVGPTASGKSALAIKLAQAFDGEIINMDSMQIYRGMDIGTAKPTLEERCGIPHHLLDIVSPFASFSVAQYAALAEETLHAVYARYKLPILVGGTGFYLRALTDGLALGGIPSDPELREQIKAAASTEEGKQALYAKLMEADPITAAKLHPNDLVRVSRAMEVYHLTGKPLSAQNTTPVQERPFLFCMLGTTLKRDKLYQKVEKRIDSMMESGLLEEVKKLLAQGVPPEAQAMQGIGYKELVPVLQGHQPLDTAIALLKRNTRRYAKRQWTWFNAESRVHWLDMDSPESTHTALQIAKEFWSNNDDDAKGGRSSETLC